MKMLPEWEKYNKSVKYYSNLLGNVAKIQYYNIEVINKNIN